MNYLLINVIVLIISWLLIEPGLGTIILLRVCYLKLKTTQYYHIRIKKRFLIYYFLT